MVNSIKRHSRHSASDTTFKTDVITLALDLPVWPLKPGDGLSPELTRREVLEELDVLHSDDGSDIQLVWCNCIGICLSDGVYAMFENRPEHRTKKALYATYLKGRKQLVSAFYDARRAYYASLAGGAA